jgi:DNA-binding MarR family transcriptional regulator
VVAGERPHPLAQYTGYLLRRAFVKSAGCVRDSLPPDGHVREWVALAIIAERAPLSQQALGQVAHVNRSLVVKLVDALEARSWVVRERSTSDRRTYALVLTDAGRAALAGVQADLDRGERALTAGLTDQERRRLRTRLSELLADDPSISVSSLCLRSGYLVAQAHRVLREHAADLLEPLGLHPRHFGLLSTLAREQPCSQSHLAARLGISSPGALATLADLETAALVSRVRNAEDRRAHDLSLTDKGQQVLRAAQRVAAEVQEEIRERLGPDGDQELRDLLTKLVVGPVTRTGDPDRDPDR